MADRPPQHGSASALVTWGRLLRLPNLFTVPGDPIAGYLLAAGVLGWDVLGAVAASMCLYCGGLLLNDYFDRHVDARERPERPIPSGAVKPRTVLAVGGLLLVAGPVIAYLAAGSGACFVAGLVAAGVYAYDAGLKKVRWLGPVVMGSCRAGSVLIGAAAAEGLMAAPALMVAAITLAYVTSVTVLASGEMSGKRPRWSAHLPPAIICAGAALMLLVRMPAPPYTIFMIATGMSLGLTTTGQATARLRRGHIPVPAFVGALLRAMIGYQTAWALWTCSILRADAWAVLIAGTVLLACSELSSRKFYGS